VTSIDIKYPIAFDSNSNIIRADDPDIQNCRRARTCCGCGEPMHYVHEFVRGGTIVTAHFRHTQNSPNCTIRNAIIAGESKYHRDYIDLLYKKMNYCIDNKIPFPTELTCGCGEIHKRNIIEKVCRVEKEYYEGGFRPDIALITADNMVITVLEIIVTHRPESDYLDHLKKHNINLLTFELNIEKNFQYWVDKYIGKDDILRPFSASFINCDSLQLHYAFSLWSRWLEDENKKMQVEQMKILELEIKNIQVEQMKLLDLFGTGPSFPLPKKGKSENIKIIQMTEIDGKFFAKIQIYEAEKFFLLHITQELFKELKEELRKFNIDIKGLNNCLIGFIFSIIGIGKDKYYTMLRYDLMKADLENLEQGLKRTKDEIKKIEQELELVNINKELEKINKELEKINKEKTDLENLMREFMSIYSDLENLDRKLMNKKSDLENLDRKLMNKKSDLENLDRERRNLHFLLSSVGLTNDAILHD
jgi:hypothetical protein